MKFFSGFRRIHLELSRNHVHHALDPVGSFGTSSAAVGIGRRAVGECADVSAEMFGVRYKPGIIRTLSVGWPESARCNTHPDPG
jgi:hypothetical protein